MNHVRYYLGIPEKANIKRWHQKAEFIESSCLKQQKNCNFEMFRELTDLSSTEIKEKTILKAPSYYHDFIWHQSHLYFTEGNTILLLIAREAKGKEIINRCEIHLNKKTELKRIHFIKGSVDGQGVGMGRVSKKAYNAYSSLWCHRAVDCWMTAQTCYSIQDILHHLQKRPVIQLTDKSINSSTELYFTPLNHFLCSWDWTPVVQQLVIRREGGIKQLWQ